MQVLKTYKAGHALQKCKGMHVSNQFFSIHYLYFFRGSKYIDLEMFHEGLKYVTGKHMHVEKKCIDAGLKKR